MAGTVELVIKGTLGLLAAAVLLWRPRLRGRWKPLLYATAIVAVAAYYNFGALHPGGGGVHHHEQFHYVLGSKYFPELGYDGSYLASYAAQLASGPRPNPNADVRELRSNRLVPGRTLEGQLPGVRARFTPERWRAFVGDHDFLLRSRGGRHLQRMRQDHGYNPTPAWTFVARLLSAWLPLNGVTARLYAAIDPLLILLCFVGIGWAFGGEVLASAMILFGLAFLSRFFWIGGAFLRQDWLCALVLGVCALAKERWRTAGLLFAYASAVRVFPALFLVGVAGLGVRTLLDRGDRRWLVRFGSGYAGGLASLGIVGAMTGRGWGAWIEFADNISLHRATWLMNNVGLRSNLVYLYDLAHRPIATWLSPQEQAGWQRSADGFGADFGWLLVLIIASMWGLVIAAAWRRRAGEAAVFGLGAVFAAVTPTCYYWACLLLLPIAAPRRITVACVCMNAVLCLLAATPARDGIFGIATWMLLAMLLAWLVPAARANVRPALGGTSPTTSQG